MRYGVFSDVHGNLEAFEAALNFYKSRGVAKFIYLGDIIGYGANPNECARLLETLEPICIAGNHDWAAIGKISTSSFSPHAREAINWAKGLLQANISHYLNSFSLVYEELDFICVHGSLIDPIKFFYILDINDAQENFFHLEKKICFVGHSHRMGIFCLRGGKIFYTQDYRAKLESQNKYIINVGSVGQPRDKNPRACVCIYDSDREVVEFERLDYNIKKAAEKILTENLPSILAERLYMGW